MSESYFDSIKNYYVFKYVVDKVSGEPTEHEGEVQAFVKAKDPWEAVTNAGFDDSNAYGANVIDNLEVFEKAMAEEKKHHNKLAKELKSLTDERDAERKKFLEERPCPNGCGKMDEKFRCKKCGYGFEGEQLVENIDAVIKEEKKKGNDTKELEAIRDAIKKDLADK